MVAFGQAGSNQYNFMPSIYFLLETEEELAMCGNGTIDAGEVCDDGNRFENDLCASSCKAYGPLREVYASGRWGVPENTFTLPATTTVYFQDLQDSFPDINWQTLDRLYIPAGSYNAVWLGNLPVRDAERPLIITNQGGQVLVNDSSSSKFVIEGGSNWVLTGRYDPISQTGHEDFTGHMNNNYANAPGNYGIFIDQGYSSGSGITVREGRADSHATDFELEYIEVADAGFAAINIKNDNNPDAHMRNVKIHDLYLHDPETECMYIGNTNEDASRQHRFENLWIFNNRGIRCGAEALQISHMGDGVRVFNNVFFLASIDWKDPFQRYQEGHFQVVARPGDIVIENNFFIGGSDTLISPRTIQGDSDTIQGGELLVRNNYFSHSRGTQLSYVHNRNSNTDTVLKFVDNVFGEIVTQRNELEEGQYPEEFYFQTKFNTVNPIVFENNLFASGRRGFSTLGSGTTEINGVQDNLTATDNAYGTADLPLFNDSGIASNFDYRKLEAWTDCSKIYENQSVNYEINDIASFHGKLYQLKSALSANYDCSHPYWSACTSNGDGTYSPISYNIGDIVDTDNEEHYRLDSEHEPYVCDPPSQVYQNDLPFEETSAWTKVTINASPDESSKWEALPEVVDDVRLDPNSPIKEYGLLDVVQ